MALIARLQTFGELALTDANGDPLVTQRQRLALLALLAAAGERGLSRDKLIAYLWPESSEENARRALQQPIYWIRHQVHKEVFLGTDPLRLNAAIVSSDLRDFEDAVASGAHEAALSLYRGPFLDGFFLHESAPFEEWVAGERMQLAGAYASALSGLAKEAERQGQHTLEIDCWRRLSALEPLSERLALRLIRSLAAAGDLAGARLYARDFESSVRRELGAAPVTDLVAYAERASTGDLPAEAAEESHRQERYSIEREIGRGSMATVYLARDRKLDRHVALKLLKPELSSSLTAKRFQREIAIASRLNHPNILPVHDSGELPPSSQGQRLYYIMPYVEGESLRDRLRRQTQLPIPDAVRLAAEVADALACAHGQGIVHRDIKPENILLSGSAPPARGAAVVHAIVADFGIAQAVELAGGERLSLSGVMLGTPSYMSPEQGTPGAVLDQRSDIYSLGCVLYEMLVGEPPFTGRTAQTILARHAVDPVPPLRTVCPDVPATIELAVEKALAKHPADRFSSAADFAAALGG